MGNENSRLKGLVIDKDAVESNDFWTLFNAYHPSTLTTNQSEGHQLLSIFQGCVLKGKLSVVQGTWERAIKNLMIYRHPYILKYVSTWEQGGQKHLATERVRPLSLVLNQQSDLQICLGLRTILCSLIFLVEKAMARHLNICPSSIYITDNGSWRLSGFEYVWKNKDVNKTLLELVKEHRHQPAVDEHELQEVNSDYIEQYAFATLCEEILGKAAGENHSNSTPHVQEFREYCATHLKHKQAQMRPKLSAVLLHPYFNHEFVLIHSFLFELPLKSIQQKQDFFTGLIDRLRYFDEEVVGAQLASDLLSRMVLLDTAAQLCVTPYVLKTKNSDAAALFSQGSYKMYIMPQILRMFRLRDAQIRLILLEYFMEYARLLDKSELEELILPHLMLGMNDTNDVLVAKTLRCLADLVPILGSAAVVGGNRSRLFSDGRPQAAVSADTAPNWVGPRSITPVMGNSLMDYMVSGSPLPHDNEEISGSCGSLNREVELLAQMPARLSPDGGEDDKSLSLMTDGSSYNPTVVMTNEKSQNSMENSIKTVDNNSPLHNKPSELELEKAGANAKLEYEEDDAWSDWETEELQHLKQTSPTPKDIIPSESSNILSQNLLTSSSNSYTTLQSQTSLDSFRTSQSNTSSSTNTQKSARILDDLNALDIQVQKLALSAVSGSETATEFDFFKDMEPVISSSSSTSLNLGAKSPTSGQVILLPHDEDIQIDSNRFAADTALTSDEATGWDVEDSGWNND